MEIENLKKQNEISSKELLLKDEMIENLVKANQSKDKDLETFEKIKEHLEKTISTQNETNQCLKDVIQCYERKIGCKRSSDRGDGVMTRRNYVVVNVGPTQNVAASL